MSPKLTTILNLSKVVKSFSGEPIKDLLEMKQGDDPKSARDLTIGSLLGNGLLIGLKDIDKKQTLKVFQIAGDLQKAIDDKDGKFEIDLDTVDKLEELWSKVDHPTFKLPLHGGAVLQSLHDARFELMKAEKEPNTA